MWESLKPLTAFLLFGAVVGLIFESIRWIGFVCIGLLVTQNPLWAVFFLFFFVKAIMA
jgi:hypothetical protein